MTIDETFETMKRLFNPAAAAGFNETIEWNITGEQAGKWTLKIADQTCQLIKGGVEKADLIMTMSDQTWLALAQGKLDPVDAFRVDKIKLSGDRRIAMHIQRLFPISGMFFGE